ncbi:unnamed protein product [Calicophoron daubneyi]|uniref:P/Homo B domain-containing protein n=1 Tax=Calicophoron daubneyi TaxID=300641 RepID=A0AAV2T760_CALDB
MLIWPIMHATLSLISTRYPNWILCLTLLCANAFHLSDEERSSNLTGQNTIKSLDNLPALFPTPEQKDPIFTPYWAVEIDGGVELAKAVADKYGFTFVDTILPGIYYFRQSRLSKRSVYHSIYYHDQLAYDSRVVWLEQQVLKVRVKRDVQFSVNDPHWPNMWYLNRGGPGGLDMNVRAAWAKGYVGQDVVVTILDDGLEKDHADLKENYDPFASYDVNENDKNPEPRYPVNDKSAASNRHGTRCAGTVAAVANNSICGLGIAYRARIGGVRMLDGDVSDAMESRSLGHQLQHIDVYSASWGPEDDGKTVDGPGRLAQLAFRNGILMGRGGLGSIFVWASGNGGKSGDNCNCDGYTSSIYTLGVSSASEHGSVPWYAERCSSTLTVTYSSGGHGERGVITTDLNHTCTNNHSGTSASAPLAAGICALTLSANPRLTWRDLQYLVVYTARPDGLYANDWRVNGVGRRVSHAFGYGLMDAGAMVDLALNWTNVPPQRVCEAQAPITGGPVAVRLMSRESLALTTDGCASAAALAGDPSQRVVYLEHVQAKVTVSSAQRGEIELWLTSPMGTVSKLLSKRPKDVDVAGFHAWPFMSVHFWGELANGTWKLTVHSGNAVVSIHDWILILYGTSSPPPMHDSTQRRGMWQSNRSKGTSRSDALSKRVAPEESSEPTDSLGQGKIPPTSLSQLSSTSNIPTSYGESDLGGKTDQHVSVSKSHSSYPYPHFYYPGGPNPYGFWAGWNQEMHGTQIIPPPLPLPPPTFVPSPQQIPHRIYAHFFPSSESRSDIQDSSKDLDTVSLSGPLTDNSPIFDFELPPLIDSTIDLSRGPQPPSSQQLSIGDEPGLMESKPDDYQFTKSANPGQTSNVMPSSSITYRLNHTIIIFLTFLTLSSLLS